MITTATNKGNAQKKALRCPHANKETAVVYRLPSRLRKEKGW